jgi:hypothetical protein
MSTNKPFNQIVDELPTDGLTIKMLRALDFVAPGQWENVVGFTNTVKKVSGESDARLIQQISDRALVLFNDKTQGYQRALWLYQTVDNVDDTLAKVALANKIGEKIHLLSFLNKFTPAADTTQTIDVSLKLVAEVAGFCLVNGIPGDSVADFVRSLADYSGEAKMRMAALLAIDGLIPLGPDFIGKVTERLTNMQPKELEKNKMFQQINEYIPGGDTPAKLGFVTKSFNAVSGWMTNFLRDHEMTVDKVLKGLSRFVELSDSKLDYVAAFLDMTTNYYEHTGTQTIALRLIERAVNEI